MKMIELITECGDDIGVQNLDQCGISLNWSEKRGTKITFGSDVKLTPNGTEKLGIVVWLPRDRVKQILARTQTGGPSK